MINPGIIFFGASKFAIPSLQALLKNNYDIKAIFWQPKDPVLSEIKMLAAQNNIQCIFKDRIDYIDINKFDAKIGILVSFGQIVKNNIIQYFEHGIINIHPSLLPKYRGPSPVQTALLNQDHETAVSLMLLDSGLDTGPIIMQKKANINDEDDYIQLSLKLSIIGAELLISALPDYLCKNLLPKKQDNRIATYSKMIHREDGLINIPDIKLYPKIIYAKYKAYNPWPGIYFLYKKKRFKIIKAYYADNCFYIDCIQPEGKKPQSIKDFNNGYPEIKF